MKTKVESMKFDKKKKKKDKKALELTWVSVIDM
jgi:hypothetical protein